MKPSQEQDLNEKLVVIQVLVNDKYRRGAAEHNGDLEDLTLSQLLDESIGEALDLLIYLLQAQKKLHVFKSNHNLAGAAQKNA